jgi:hypothetical protein
MARSSKKQVNPPVPPVEIHIAANRLSAAAGEKDTRLTPEQVTAIQQTVTSLIDGFHPPAAQPEDSSFLLDSLEVDLGFTVEASAGITLKLVLNAKAQASINVKVVWSRKK